LQGADPSSSGSSWTLGIVARSIFSTGGYDAGSTYCFPGGLQIHDVSAPDSSVSSFMKPQSVLCLWVGTQSQQVKNFHHHRTPSWILGVVTNGQKHVYKILEI